MARVYAQKKAVLLSPPRRAAGAALRREPCIRHFLATGRLRRGSFAMAPAVRVRHAWGMRTGAQFRAAFTTTRTSVDSVRLLPLAPPGRLPDPEEALTSRSLNWLAFAVAGALIRRQGCQRHG